jgi:hypothetical protein
MSSILDLRLGRRHRPALLPVFGLVALVTLQAAAQMGQQKLSPWDENKVRDERVAKLVSQMTLEEKVSQMIIGTKVFTALRARGMRRCFRRRSALQPHGMRGFSMR